MTFSLATLLAGSFLCSWAVLRCVGNERERRVREMENRLAAESAAADPASAAPVLVAQASALGKPAR